MSEIREAINWHLSELKRYTDMIPVGTFNPPQVEVVPQYSILDIERAERTSFATNDTGGVVAEYNVGQLYFIWIELVDTNGVHINDQDLPFGIRLGSVNTGDDEGFDRQEGTYSVYRYVPSASSTPTGTSIFTAGTYLDDTRSDANALLATFELPIVGGSMAPPPLLSAGIDRTGFTSLNISNLIPRGSFTSSDWSDFYSPEMTSWFTDNLPAIAVKDIDGHRALEMEHVPAGGSGSGTIGIKGGGRYVSGNRTSGTIVQRVRLPDGYDFSPNSSATQKLGFGFRSREDSSGGTPAQDGFSSRFQWRRRNGKIYWGTYVYAADTVGFGDDFLTDVEVTTGEWVELAMAVTMNSSFGSSDGTLKFYVNGELVRTDTGIRWMAEARDNEAVPNIEGVAFNSFHGGSNSLSWEPSSNQYPAYADVAFLQSA